MVWLLFLFQVRSQEGDVLQCIARLTCQARKLYMLHSYMGAAAASAEHSRQQTALLQSTGQERPVPKDEDDYNY